MSIRRPAPTPRRRPRPREVHPSWCARDHQCTAAHGGEHRSDPAVWKTPYGRLVAVRIQHVSGAGRLEVRTVVRLPADGSRARTQAANSLLGVDLAMRSAAGLPTDHPRNK